MNTKIRSSLEEKFEERLKSILRNKQPTHVEANEVPD